MYLSGLNVTIYFLNKCTLKNSKVTIYILYVQFFKKLGTAKLILRVVFNNIKTTQEWKIYWWSVNLRPASWFQ